MNKLNTLVIKTDGGARGNPGPAAIGVYVTDLKTRKKIAGFGKYIGHTTNNVAEYQAIIEAFKWLVKNVSVLTRQYTSILFICDSKLIVNQLAGLYKIKKAHLQQLYLQIKTLELKITLPIIYRHVVREQNKEPDKILNKVLDNQKL